MHVLEFYFKVTSENFVNTDGFSAWKHSYINRDCYIYELIYA